MIRRFLNFIRFQFHQKLQWSRPDYQETPVGDLTRFDQNIHEIIKLKKNYPVSFEDRLSFDNARDNFFYLDLLNTWRGRMDRGAVIVKQNNTSLHGLFF